MIPWKYKGKVVEEVPEGAEGFIYEIVFENGDFYIGKKSFWSVRRVKVKGRINKKKIVKESNWQVYASSSKIVKKRIESGEAHTKLIVHMCASKACTMYFEVYEMIMRKVLCAPKALNLNIFLKMFKCVEPMDI